MFFAVICKKSITFAAEYVSLVHEVMKRMKYVALFIVAVLCFSACKTDLTDIEKRIEEIERQGQELADANKKLQEESENLKRQSEELEAEAKKRQEENEKIQKRLQELEDSLNTVEPFLLSMEFLAADNPYQMIENATCTIIGDSAVECRILNITDDKVLIPRFTFQGSVVTINGVEATSGETSFDFSSPVVLSVITAKDIKDYKVYVNAYTGLPSAWVDTNGHYNVANANQYYGGSFKLIASQTTIGSGNAVTKASMKIMGMSPLRWYRSDYAVSTCDDMLPAKNTYIVRFNNSISLFDEPNGQAWRLCPNNNDLTFLHNQIAFYMSSISNLEYTPRMHFVDFFLNKTFFGTYGMVERLESSENRVNVGNDGFILSIGADEAGSTFYTKYLERPVTVLAPGSPSADAVSYASVFVQTAENALFSSNFTDVSTGWQKYMDMDSFVDWYLINEIAKNPDGAFISNCVMNLQVGGKLKMGPLWDFEEAFSNLSQETSSGFLIKNVNWYARLFQDPAFVAKVKERFAYFYDHQQDIISDINANAEYLKYAVLENDNRWNNFAKYKSSSSSDTWVLYGMAIGNMKSWLVARMNWLKKEFDAMA